MTSRARRLWRWFPAVVFGALLAALVREHSRPASAELPRFDPPAEVQLAPVTIPGDGERVHVLAGRVVDSRGTPSADVLVELSQDGEIHWAWTDERGAFELRGLGAGEVSVALVQIGRPPVVRAATLPSGVVDWSLPDPWPRVEGLPEIRRQALYGSVRSPLEAPVADYELVLEPLDGSSPLAGVVPRRAPVARDGGFAVVDLALGRYRISLAPLWAGGASWPRFASVDYEHGPEVGDVDLVLDAGVLTGLVADAEGVPVPGALLLVASAEHPERVWPPRRTDEDGSFAVGDLPPGEYAVALRAGAARIDRRVAVAAARRTAVDFGPVEVGE